MSLTIVVVMVAFAVQNWSLLTQFSYINQACRVRYFVLESKKKISLSQMGRFQHFPVYYNRAALPVDVSRFATPETLIISKWPNLEIGNTSRTTAFVCLFVLVFSLVCVFVFPTQPTGRMNTVLIRPR